LTGEKIASLVDEMLKEFKNDFMIAAVLQPRKELPVWKVVLTRHNPEPQERLTIAVDLHSGDTHEGIKAAVQKEILQAIEGEA